MNKAKVLSFATITLLILQLFSINPGISISQAAHEEGHGHIEVKSKHVSANTLEWEIVVRAASEEASLAPLKVTFDSGQAHHTIDFQQQSAVEKKQDGYDIEIQADGNSNVVGLTTKISKEGQTNFTVNAEMDVEGKTYRDEATVELAQEDESKEEAVSEEVTIEKEEEKAESRKERQESDDREAKEEVKQEAPAKPAGEETDPIGEVEPLEQYDNIPPQAKMTFPIARSNMKTMNSGSEPTATHKMKEAASANICLRVVEGEVEFFLPIPEVKRPVDIVIVQDASGSYSGNEGNARNSLLSIVNMLDFSPGQDRMMVTSYRGHKGWDHDPIRTRGGSYTTTDNGSGVITTTHAPLTNNKNNLISGINQIKFDGGTPTASGLQYARQQYEAATQGEDLAERERIFVLVTDGVANVRLDGRVHVTGTTLNERYQKYQGTFSQVEDVASSIKTKYKMFSAYWENLASLRTTYGTNFYNDTIGPAARTMVKNVASSANYYSTSQDINTVMQALLENLQTTINQYDGFEASFEIADGFELIDGSVQLNGNDVDYSRTGKTVKITTIHIPSGDNKITYKLKETSLHEDTSTPVSNGVIKYDKEANTFKGSLDIPNATLTGNKNRERCNLLVIKGVAAEGSDVYTENIELENESDTFKYALEYQFDGDIANNNTVQLKDELEAVLELIGTEADISITSDSIPSIPHQINLLPNQSGFTIDIGKENGSYNYLAGNKIRVYFKAKFKDDVTETQMGQYIDGKVPNETSLLLDGKPTTSNKVYVKYPPKGTIKIIKVDADDPTITLADASFVIKDETGEVVNTIVTGSNGEAISKPLAIGNYTVEEVKAPHGYEILPDQKLNVSVVANETSVIRIENKKLQGSIKVVKVNADNHEEKLSGASFQLLDDKGNLVSEGETSANGEYVFENVPIGSYQLKETKAPSGYRILKQTIDVEVSADELFITKIIENSEKGWQIPDTGGMGSLGFYSVGFMLITGAAWFLLRRRYV
ncbi:MAG TPA: SpaA isopeptide-forming pilin-related protein [Pseudogracilibacillus sp.]|nr:SpaA isopeptide-forming pilin-related protein [Pseudogracilibacillus sp.]